MRPDILHVAVGVIRNNKNQVLLSRRSRDVRQANLWEFPGGKLELGETARQTLSRELSEELALTVKSAKPFIKIHHNYEKYAVLLEVLEVDSWDSSVLNNSVQQGQEGQEIEWVDISSLGNRDFPAANKAIVKAVQLPHFYLICPDPEAYQMDYINKFETYISAGISLFQLRFHDSARYDKYEALIIKLLELCKNSHSRLLINGTPEHAIRIGVDGVHLNSTRLLRCFERPLDKNFLVSASCHNSTQLEHACKIDADFAVLSPVNRTSSHPSAKPLGWDNFKKSIRLINMPVYALGGMQTEDIKKYRAFDAQGIAMLSGIWDQDDVEKVLNK